MEAGQQQLKRMDPEDEFGDGVWVQMNGRREYLLPPLNFHTLKTKGQAISTMAGLKGGDMPSPEQLELLAEIVHSSVVRNYPSVKREDVEQWINIGNFIPIFEVLMKASGLVRRTEAPEPGKAAA